MPIAAAEPVRLAPKIACVLLAAGRSQRFGRTRINKLLSDVDGRVLIRSVLDTVLQSAARPIVVVSGHQHQSIATALQPLKARRWRLRINPQHRRGMSGSIIRGLQALPDDLDGVLIVLGDMPAVDARLIDQMIRAYRGGDDAVIARVDGQRGNPVLIGRALLPELLSLRGDVGARRLLQQPGRSLRFVDSDPRARRDIDTRRDLTRWRRGKRSR